MGKVYNNVQNKDEVLFRNIIVGTLFALKDNIYWYNVINNEKSKVDVPIYYTMAGSERLLSDIFLNSDELIKEGKATGVYEKFPRAHVSLDSLTLQEEYLTNKFKRAPYLKREGEEIKQYSAEFIEAPFQLNYSVTIFVDSHIDIYKCIQSIFENLYKNVYFWVDVFNVKIPCYFSIPSNVEKEYTIPFGISDKKENKITLELECQCSYPIFKEGTSGSLDTSRFAGNTMNAVQTNLYIVSDKNYVNQDTTVTNSDGTTTDLVNTNITDSIGKDIVVTKDVWPTGNNQNAFPD
jgi:hypothetical protein